jgi:hypothetical protein
VKFVLNVTSPDCNWRGIAVVDLAPAAIKVLLARRELYQMVKSRDEDINTLFFWDATNCTYYENANLDDLFDEGTVEKLEDGDGVVLLAEVTANFEELLGEMEYVELDQILIDDEGIRFYAGLEHSNEYIQSALIKYELLLAQLPTTPTT